MALGLTMIDERLRGLVVDLNAAGFVTGASCQGRRHAHEFASKTHLPAAYLTFEEPMPSHVAAELTRRDRHLYADDRGGPRAVTAIAVGVELRGPATVVGYRRVDDGLAVEHWTDEAMQRVIAANEHFVDDVRAAFGVPETKELLVDVLYFGPALSGRSMSLQQLQRAIDPARRSEITSEILASGARTISLTTTPRALSPIEGRTVALRLVTMPGAIFDPQGDAALVETADAVVFVADSQVERREANEETLARLRDLLQRRTLRRLEDVPHVFQYNKRDLPNVLSRAQLDAALNAHGAPAFETSAHSGAGLLDALKEIARRVDARMRLPRHREPAP